jgi:NADPH-dependent 2,4-dienoyl-CoA reductase/sulfur reductase-like enzyme
MKVIIIGCTHAGTAAAKTIRTQHPDASITVYERNETISFLSCGIALHVGGMVKDIQSLFYSSPEQLAAAGVTVRMRHEVGKVDFAGRTVEVKDLATGKASTDSYDKLVITTGSWPITPPIPGINLKGVMLAKNYDHAREIVSAQRAAKRIMVVGAGYIGVELVEAFAEQGKLVTLVDRLPRIFGKYFDPEFSAPVEKALQEHGVTLALDQAIVRFEGDNGELRRVVTDAGTYETDLAVFCIGFQPATAIFKGGLTMLPNGAIIVDDYMRTSQPDVFAAGDCCAVRYNPTGKPKYIPLATNAVRMGTLAGRNLLAPTVPSQGTQGTSSIMVFGHCLAATGLTEATAAEEGIEATSVTISDNDRPEFMPDYAALNLKVVYEKQTGRVLGGQLHSKKDLTQAINTLSLAVQKRMTMDELAFTDFFFLPHFNKPWHFLNLAGLAKK